MKTKIHFHFDQIVVHLLDEYLFIISHLNRMKFLQREKKNEIFPPSEFERSQKTELEVVLVDGIGRERS